MLGIIDIQINNNPELKEALIKATTKEEKQIAYTKWVSENIILNK